MQKFNGNRSFLFLVFLVISSCASYEPFYSDGVDGWQSENPPNSVNPDYSLFLIGDSRSAYTSPASLTMLENQLSKAGENSAVIFLATMSFPMDYLIRPINRGILLRKACWPNWKYFRIVRDR